MRNLLSMAIIATAATLLVACTSKKQEMTQAPKALVLYYSQTGTTKAVAEGIQQLTDADIAVIEAEEAYDGDFGETIARVQQERSENVLPKLKTLNVNITDYDTIYLGYPIWFGTYAPPIIALLEAEKFEGKTIIPFCTFGSGGLEASVNDLKNALPNATILDGYGVRTIRIKAASAEIDRFLKENNLIDGEVDVLPEFSDTQPVGETEKTIFNMACSDYQFPLGTPVTFATRETAQGKEYKYGVDNQSTIYVIVSLAPTGEVSSAEFTKVVR